MIFYLGTHEPTWLGTVDVPLFLSYHRMYDRLEKGRKSAFRPAKAQWALDSGGFTELDNYGKWTIPPKQYVKSVLRYRDEIGMLDWCAPQDWMCEDRILRKTGLSVRIHQDRTIQSYLDLKAMAPDLPVAPVLQGWLLQHYLEHIEAWERAGVDLRQEPIVALGTMCRRQDTLRASWIVREIAERGIRAHALGAKVTGLGTYSSLIASSDSLAWSMHALKQHLTYSPHCHHKDDGPCNNCRDWALAWRESDVLTFAVPPAGAPLAEAEKASLEKGSRVRAEHGGAPLAPFGRTHG